MLRCAYQTVRIDCEAKFRIAVRALVDAVSGPATLIRLTADSGAGAHCAGVGQRVWEAAVYDWINRVIAKGATTPQRSLP